jgi:excisionase family DNA binding protein
MRTSLLSTGQAARLCSVKPDTVLKWIKHGLLPATRTVGGHYRVEQHDLAEALAHHRPEPEPPPAASLCARPMRCWEYMNNGPGEDCRNCSVYHVHAAWCFRMTGSGHGKRFCVGACQDCPYFRRVHSLPTNILVVTQDEPLIQSLAKDGTETLAFRFARRGYDASAIISVFRPAFVVFDEATVSSLGPGLLDALATDPRTTGARIVLAVRKNSIGRRVHSNSVFATIQLPFEAAELAALAGRIPVETLSQEGGEAEARQASK